MSGPVPSGPGSELATNPIPSIESQTLPQNDSKTDSAVADARKPSPATRDARPVIQLTALNSDSGYRRLVKAQVPALAISSVVHGLIFALLLCAIGSTRPTDAKTAGLIINTATSPAALSDADYSIGLKSLDIDAFDTRAAGDATKNDPTSTAVKGLNELPSLTNGIADDAFAALLKNGCSVAGVGAPGGSDSEQSQQGAGGGGSTTFFGTAARGKRFAIIADNSFSMLGPPLAYLKTEITNTLSRSRGNAQFYVTFFSNEALPQPLKRWTNNREDIAAVCTWVKGVETSNGTVPISGFEHVLRLNPPPDVVYFMTDGEFDPREVEQIRMLNQALNPPAVIHTVAFGGRKGEAELKLIAKQAKGTYRYVANPAKR